MPEMQGRFVALLRQVLDEGVLVEEEVAPEWLVGPGRPECGRQWSFVQHIYGEVTGLVLPDIMPPRERRRLDVLLTHPDGTRRAVEFDESQHFTGPRATTLAMYDGVPVGFDIQAWRLRCEERTGREPGGGFARPRLPLFPEAGGRHRQRAFRDVLADVVPPEHGWAPTVRFSDVEVQPVLLAEDPRSVLRESYSRKVQIGNKRD